MKITVVGDIMMGRGVESYVKDYGLPNLFMELDCDLTDGYAIANLESLLLNNKMTTSKLGAPESFAVQLRNAGINAVSLANNHILDLEKAGLCSTIKALSDNNIKYFGAGETISEATKPVILEGNGINIGIMSFSYTKEATLNSFGIANMFSKHAQEKMRELKNEVDYIITMVHSGIELYEFPLPRDQKLYKTYIDCGSDIIIGSHSHCIQAMERYKGKYIFYGIGDSIFDHYEPTVWNGFWEGTTHPYIFDLKVSEDLPRYSLVIEIEIHNDSFNVRYKPIKSKASGPWLRNLSITEDKSWSNKFDLLNDMLLNDKNTLIKRIKIENELLKMISKTR